MPDWGAIPWVAVVAGVVAAQVIGFLWYGPLFGKPWMAALGITPEMAQDRSGLGQTIGTGVVMSILATVAIAIIMTMSDTPDVASGIKVGLLTWVPVASYIFITMVYEKRPQTSSMIAVGNTLVTHVVVGAILGAMW